MSYTRYLILEEAYDQYQRSNNREFTVRPKNSEYLMDVLNTVPTFLEQGFATDVTDNLLDDNPITIQPMEHMSFTITAIGVEYVRRCRDS